MPNTENAFFNTYDESVSPTRPIVLCGNVFRALAVNMLEYLQTHTFIDNALLPFARAYFEKYPGHFLSAYTGSLLKQLQTTMLQTKSPDTIVDQMATIFYQLTLAGLLKNPTRYHEFALPPETREYPAHWIAQSAPAVIADVLKITLRVHHAASGKPLHATTHYKPSSDSTVSFHLTERHGIYGVYVTEKDKFASLTFDGSHYPNDDAQLAKLRPQLDKEIKSTLSKFHDIYDRLCKMVEAGELSKTFLMQLYVEAIDPYRAHGTQAFFDSIHIEEDHGGHVSVELLHAIARMLSLNIINLEKIFEKIETPSPIHARA